MILTVEVQFMSIIISVFAGLAIGLLFDLYRTINFFTRPKKVFLYFMDLLFWIVTACVVFFILLRADYAELRIYTFFGIAIGIFIYLKLFTEYVLKFYRFIIYSISKIIRLLFIFILLPLKLLYTLIWNIADFIKKQAVRLFKIIRKKLTPLFKRGNEKK